MSENAKKGTLQALMLVGLLLVLGFLAFRMVGAMKPKRHSKHGASTTTTASNGGETKGGTPSSTNMPPVPKTGEPRDKGGMELGASDLHINPNQFKVYALNPPKNPFVQQEEWYSDELKKIPGYPQLKGSDYLNQNEAYLPNIPLINEHEWEAISVDRTVTVKPYEISGNSDDGQISTSIKLVPKGETSEQLTWTPATGVPVSALKSPAWKDRYGDLLSQPIQAASKKPGEEGFVADALGVPGDGGSRSADGVIDGSGAGDALYAVGVSHHGKEATALIRQNGKTRIVREGSVLPTHFQVLTIKENGVVVVDLRDGSSNWLPLGAAPAESTKAKAKAKDA